MSEIICPLADCSGPHAYFIILVRASAYSQGTTAKGMTVK